MKWYLKVLREYANFIGRAGRGEYWNFVLINFGIAIGISIIDSILKIKVFSTIYLLATLLPSIGVAIRRMHDVNKSGWFILVPIYNLILACKEGDHGSNPYGPGPNHEETVLPKIK